MREVAHIRGETNPGRQQSARNLGRLSYCLTVRLMMRDAGDPDSTKRAETRKSPRSRRGTRTRAALVAAARSVFERDGYLASRVTDIADEARVAHGTFYTYFDSKAEVFAAVLHELQRRCCTPA